MKEEHRAGQKVPHVPGAMMMGTEAKEAAEAAEAAAVAAVAAEHIRNVMIPKTAKPIGLNQGENLNILDLIV